MIRALRLLPGLATLLFLAGCQAVGEKEAQLEFERLRQRTITPQGDRVYPSFGVESSSAEARRGVLPSDPWIAGEHWNSPRILQTETFVAVHALYPAPSIRRP